jgi:hypothetical protein
MNNYLLFLKGKFFNNNLFKLVLSLFLFLIFFSFLSVYQNKNLELKKETYNNFAILIPLKKETDLKLFFPFLLELKKIDYIYQADFLDKENLYKNLIDKEIKTFLDRYKIKNPYFNYLKIGLNDISKIDNLNNFLQKSKYLPYFDLTVFNSEDFLKEVSFLKKIEKNTFNFNLSLLLVFLIVFYFFLKEFFASFKKEYEELLKTAYLKGKPVLNILIFLFREFFLLFLLALILERLLSFFVLNNLFLELDFVFNFKHYFLCFILIFLSLLLKIYFYYKKEF